MNEEKKLLIICGPTATGKTDLALHLANKFDGELVNADSRQVYKDIDIITGKDIPRDSKFMNKGVELGIENDQFSVGFRKKNGVPIWLVDVVGAHYIFNVGEYRTLAMIVIENILLRNKLPIIVGGTGLYIKSLIQPLYFITVPPDYNLRKELALYSLKQLQQKLKKLDVDKWVNMNESDQKNPRRLVRAIELSLRGDKVIKKKNHPHFQYFIIGLRSQPDVLRRRIDERVESRIQQGAVEEAKNIFEMIDGKNTLPIASSSGLRQLSGYFNKQELLESAVEKWKLSERQYAKRQMTWFNKYKDIHWFDIDDGDPRIRVEALVRQWYT